jgi:hypothetical protein
MSTGARNMDGGGGMIVRSTSGVGGVCSEEHF